MRALPVALGLLGAPAFTLAVFAADAGWDLVLCDAGPTSAVGEFPAATVWLPTLSFGSVDGEEGLACAGGGAGRVLFAAWLCPWLAAAGAIAPGEAPELAGPWAVA